MSNKQRKYFSLRIGKQAMSIAFDGLRKLILTIFEDFQSKAYFDEYFGSNCIDAGYTPGKAGANLKNYALRKLRKDIWPLDGLSIESYSEEDLFDMIEFLFDHISKPLKDGANYHSWGNCGWHYVNFDQLTAQKEFMDEVNQFLNDYSVGYEISAKGEILSIGDPHLQQLFNVPLPAYDPQNIEGKIALASDKFRRYGSSLSDRAEAVRVLADCLEFLRPEIKKIIPNKDESDLFNIANNFGVRHHNSKQKTNYDKNIWLSWMFYFYLATLHACIRIIKKQTISAK